MRAVVKSKIIMRYVAPNVCVFFPLVFTILIDSGVLLRFQTSTSTFYKSCACVEAKSDPFGKVEKGACEANCGLQLVLFLLVVSAITLMTFVNDTPALIVTLR